MGAAVGDALDALADHPDPLVEAELVRTVAPRVAA
jgi:hypothetical protein